MQELLDTKTHQLWLDSGSGYKPWRDYIYLEDEYDLALRAASYYTQKGYRIKLVTSVVTFVL